MAGVVLLSAVLAAGMIGLGRSRWDTGDEQDPALALTVIPLAGMSWFLLAYTQNLLQWNHTPPLWPIIAALGIVLAARWWFAAAILTGWLASMNGGWLLMMPVVGACIWRERKDPLLLIAMLIWPLAAYGAYRHEWESMWSGILGGPFERGAAMAEGVTSWRFASIHVFTDLLLLRPVVYVLALIGTGALAWRAYHAPRREQRLNSIALAGLLLILCQPETFIFHWMSYAVLLAGLIPAAALAGQEEEAAEPAKAMLPLGAPEILLGAATALIPALLVANSISSGMPGTITSRPDFRQPPDENLFYGFNVSSGDHTWGREPHMTTGFTLDQHTGGLLELRIGTLGGEFTPYNPFTVIINGRPQTTFFVLPGEFTYARLVLQPDDVHIGFNAVDIDTQWARSARSVNVAPDDRPLSIALQGMRFIPYANLPGVQKIAQRQ